MPRTAAGSVTSSVLRVRDHLAVGERLDDGRAQPAGAPVDEDAARSFAPIPTVHRRPQTLYRTISKQVDGYATIDTAVIGGGVVGLAAALAIARRGHSVCVLEREPRPGMGTSTHNSQVIHAGIYYPPGTLKARHCVEGARMLYEFCAAHGVPHARCGKLIVAQNDGRDRRARGAARARRGERRARASRSSTQAFIRAREPHVRATAALFSPDTGILEAEALVRTLARLCADAGCRRPAGNAAHRRRRRRNGVIELRTPVGTNRGARRSSTRRPVRRRRLGGARRRGFRIYPCRGEYAELVPAKRALVNGLVYPLPHASATASACT